MGVNPLGFDSVRGASAAAFGSHLVVRQRSLRRVLAFLNRSIDDVINNPIVRNEVAGFYKLSRQIDRSCEVTELERRWNRLQLMETAGEGAGASPRPQAGRAIPHPPGKFRRG